VHRIRWIGELTGSRIAFVTRYGAGILPEPDTVLQEGDLLHVVMKVDEKAAVEAALSQPPKENK